MEGNWIGNIMKEIHKYYSLSQRSDLPSTSVMSSNPRSKPSYEKNPPTVGWTNTVALTVVDWSSISLLTATDLILLQPLCLITFFSSFGLPRKKALTKPEKMGGNYSGSSMACARWNHLALNLIHELVAEAYLRTLLLCFEQEEWERF